MVYLAAGLVNNWSSLESRGRLGALEKKLEIGREKKGGLFDVDHWVAGYERALACVWDAGVHAKRNGVWPHVVVAALTPGHMLK